MTASGFVLFLVTGLAWLGYELFQAVRGKPTISEQVWSFDRKWPPILFLVGVLAGHLFTQ